ncbi:MULTISPECIES: ABC-three component system middle component 5 [unclassified Bradyrhizobium]|uniref:ABC-three component system middle component 5 n=1 Tax=unclassified Bradyrhizobium TaxID=2631580 RepID=UPI0028E754F3|nr:MULTISPECIES: ABC-three component system middle component 5 [unclassified Bradyrhizobium]
MALVIQLTYEPALDPFHAIFRFLRLRRLIAKDRPIHRDHARILDFYQLFPYRVDAIRLKQPDRRFRRLASEFATRRPYGEQPDDRLLFNRMEPMQVAALDTLAANNLIDPERWKVGEVLATDQPVPPALAARLEEANYSEHDLADFLHILAVEYDLTGPNGLKARTGLMEHRQDAI